MAALKSISFKGPNINFLSVLGILGLFIFFLGFALLLPMIIAFVYGEAEWDSFLYSALIAFTLGGGTYYFCGKDDDLRIREGFLIVTLTWLLLSLVGALPFIISNILPSYTDAVFEVMSGLTTTGSTIFGGTAASGFENPDIEALPYSFLFWRSLCHWLGGMGIIVLSLAILPLLGVGGMQLFKAESSVPTTDKLTPHVRETAKLLWVVYVAFTGLQFLLLWIHPSMDWFDAINHAFSTLATGGFSTKDASVAAFDSAYIDTIIIIFMFLAGISFAMHFRLLRGDTKSFFNNRETRFYTLLTALGIISISSSLFFFDGYSFGEAIRYGSFQVVSIVTTTGFGTDDYELWYSFGGFILFLMFFLGGCAGSTGGGPKMIRWMIIIRNTFREIKQIVHPNAVLPIRIGDKVIDRNIQRTVLGFFVLYLITFGIGALIVAAFGYDMESAIGASIASLGNIGPAWGEFGPTDNYAELPYFVKWILILLMLVGRLEIFTVLILFSPAFWKQ